MPFEYEHHYGGIILRDKETGRDIFFQPGDDSQAFLDAIGEDEIWFDDIAREYFACLGDGNE